MQKHRMRKTPFFLEVWHHTSTSIVRYCSLLQLN